MGLRIIKHARERMHEYGITEEQIKETLQNPDILSEGKQKRKIAQKRLNTYILRVIYEKNGETKTVITAYKAKRERYEI